MLPALNFKNATVGEKVHGSLSFLRTPSRLLLTLSSCLLAGIAAFAQTNVTTQHYDIARTGANTNETILTPANVNTTTFGKLFSTPVDGWVYAQPLYMPGITMGTGTAQAGTTHNVVFVVTEHDSVFAFDADSNTGANANPLWQVSLIDAAHGGNPSAGEKTVPSADVSYNPPDITPEIGITSTPVIDPTTNTIYVVAKSTIGDTTFYQRLHALDITTGAEKFGGPTTLAASVPGTGNGSSGETLNWDPKWENNRASLLLLNGIVYIGFGSHMDQGPWHGWILAYNAATLVQTGAWCSTPNAAAAGIWMGGTGLAADVPTGKPYGRIFTATGNGTYDAVAPNYSNAMDYGDSIIKLDLTNGVPTMISGTTTVGDDFTPLNQASLNNNDEDQASGGVVILPDSVGGSGHQLVQVGKSSLVYVLNRESLGGYHPSNTTDPGTVTTLGGGLWGAPAYWNGNVYIWGTNNNLEAFAFANGTFTSSTPSSQGSQTATTYSPTPTVSANGTTNGIVWSLLTDNYSTEGTEILYAHNATNLATLLYSSAQNPTRDNPGNSVKFIVPTVINGKVYVGSESQLSVFGLLNGATQAATPAISPASQTFNNSIQVTITDATTGATIYYTTNGTTPTTASTLYTAPITISSTTTVNAMATGTGLLQSPVASANYTLSTQVLTPTLNPAPGTYSTTQSVTITTTTPNATIYYTTNGTTPTASSTLYTGPISVSSTETIQAVAVASGLSNSPIVSGLYTIFLNGVSSINFGSGFTAGSMDFIGSAKLNGTALELTDGGSNEAAAAWYQVEANIDSFTTDFTFQITPASTTTADGFTFTIQGNNASAIGPSGGGLGYGPDTVSGTPGIGSSVAVKFDLYSNAGEGVDSTGLYTNGASPTVPAVDMTSSGVNLHSGDPFHVHMTYDGTNLVMTITDTTTNASFSDTWPVDIPTIAGGDSAYVGFTAGTGGDTATQSIQTWTYVSTGGQATATPTFNLAAGTYLGTQTVTISDSMAGATIYYTTDGTTPTTSSTQYSGAITVSASETINALALAAGYTSSAVATASYVIESQVAAPTFTPAAGSYVNSVSVTLAATSGATIYYSTNGTTPTTSSTPYTGPIALSTTTTIQAIAVASGFFNSNVSSATYTITSGGTTAINLGSGFTAGAMTLNGNATLNGTRLRLTDGGSTEASSAWYTSAVNIQQFTTNFSFQITGGSSPTADGFTFAIQGGPSSALGTAGGGLGYGPTWVGATGGIPNSVAVKFDLYSNYGEGVDSTGLYTNGAWPTTPAVDMTSSGVNLHTTDIFNVQIVYDGTNLTMTITDTVTNATFTHAWPINIPATVGGNTALVGFTGGTGGLTAIQDIIGWTLSSSTSGVTSTPTFSPAAGTYSSAQSVTISDTTSGATIYYTTNGTTPTTSSTQYTAPITVGATETIQAIAVASGYAQSGVGSAAYTISLPVAATPTFSPAAGTYTSSQSVTISDSTSGATIYYTTNGTTPTTGSTVYTAPVVVSVTETLEAIAVATGYSQSAVASAAYTITPPAATPTFSPVAGTYSSAQSVTISDTTTGATLYYTTNGTTPTTSSTKYTAPVSVSATETIEAIAVATGYSQSAVGSAAYTISVPVAATPTFSPVAGTYSSAQSVTISDTTTGATIYYTTNGTTPTTSSTKYTAPVSVTATETLEAIAVATGYSQSAVGSAAYTITPPAAAPTFSPVAGTYSSAQSVTISDTTTGATIYYTTNGTTPTTSSTKYTAAITVNATETLEAIAVATGYSQSAVGSATYTISIPAPVITSATTASGKVGTAFSYQITASNTPTSFGATGLPSGLTVSSSTGLISGTPTVAGTSTVTLSATNSGGTGTATLTLTIAPAAPVITSATSASGTVGTAFSYQITATNTPTSYGATGLPAGLSVSSTTGLISGTPTTAATSTVTISATNSGGTGTATLTLTIKALASISSVQAAANKVTSASTSSLAFPSSTKAGDVILVAFDYDTSSTPTSVVDSQGNVFTAIGNQLTTPGGARSRVYYAANIKGGADTVTITLSANSGWIELYLSEYTGVSSTSPIDAQAGATGIAGPVTSGNATTSLAGDVIYGYCVGDWACTVGTGDVARSTFDGNLIEDQTVGNAGSYAAAATANSGWSMQMVALKP
jgi:hypothetical protein